MSLLEAKRVLSDTRSETSLDAVTSAISVIAGRLQNSHISEDIYTEVVRALVDRVAERLSTSIAEINDGTIRQFESIFLKGSPSVAFTELTNALRSNGGADLLAKTLILFVDDKTGGSQRLRQILSNAEIPEIVSALIHLPSRIINVLLQSDASAPDVSDVINETVYIATLSDAVYQQAATPDPQRDHLLSDLLRRLITIGHSETIISRWLSRRDESRFVTAFLRAPQPSMLPLLRALLDAPTADDKGEARISRYLRQIVHANASALDACVQIIPLERPLFRRPKRALNRLVACVVAHGQSDAKRALLAASELWSSQPFVAGTDVLLQRQVTRLVLLYLRATTRAAQHQDGNVDSDVMMTLVNGVHHRLGESDERIRRHGMVIGEASSRYYAEKELLKFDRTGLAEKREGERRVVGEDEMEDGGDSDFSELADSVGQEVKESDDDVKEENNQVSEDVTIVSSGSAASESRRGSQDVFWDTEGPDRDWQKEDDWSSISSYASTPAEGISDTEEDVQDAAHLEALREKLSALHSIPRVLSFLREQNNTKNAIDYEALTSALKAIATRAEGDMDAARGTLVQAAPELVLEILRVNADRLPDVESGVVGDVRWKAAINVCCIDIAHCVDRLLECVVCGGGADVARRAEGLRVMTESIRRYMGREESEENTPGESNIESIGRVTRVLSRSLAVSKQRANSKNTARSLGDEDVLIRCFQRLGTLLTSTRESLDTGAQFLQLDGADSALWAQGLLALCVLSTHMGRGAGRECRRVVAEIAVGRVCRAEKSADVIVRRAAVLALAGLEGGMEDWEIEEEMGGEIVVGELDDESALRKGLGWVMEVAEGAEADADVGVRRFAGLALGRWAKRLEGVSGGGN